MLDAFLAAFQALDPQHSVCVLRTFTRDFHHQILRRLRRTGQISRQPVGEGDTVELVFDFYDPMVSYPNPISCWRLRCLGVQYHHIQRDAVEPIGDLTVTRDHVLLWPHHYPRKDLWVADMRQLAFGAVAAVAQEHQRLVQDWFPLTHMLRLDAPHTSAMGASEQLLASGPAPLLDAYAAVLIQHGVALTLRDSPIPFLRTSDTENQTDPTDPIVLVFGRSYLVMAEILVDLLDTDRKGSTPGPRRSGRRKDDS